MNRSAEIANARKVDTEVARLWSLYYEVADQILVTVKRLDGYRESFERYVALDLQIRASQVKKNVEACEAQVAKLREQAAPLRKAAQDFDKANYEGWNRFFLVKHIHNTVRCSSFRPTTKIGWLPDVSGLTEVEAVKAHGEALCTICFPSAPVALTTKPVDESVCAGHAVAPMRTGFYRGNWATCSDCGQQIALTSTGKLRKHNK